MTAELLGPATWSDSRISERMAEDAREHHPSGWLCLPVECVGRIVRKVRDDYAWMLAEQTAHTNRIRKANHKLALMLGAIKELERYDYFWTTYDQAAIDLLHAKEHIAGLEENIVRRAERQAMQMALVGECLIELEQVAPDVARRLGEQINEMLAPAAVMKEQAE